MEKLTKEEREKNVRQYWVELKEPFVLCYDVPNLPIPLEDYQIKKLIELGAIPKDRLEDGILYYGEHRRTHFAKWNAKENKFEYRRFKFGTFFIDDCKHFQDDDNFALFVPIRKATEEEFKAYEEKK